MCSADRVNDKLVLWPFVFVVLLAVFFPLSTTYIQLRSTHSDILTCILIRCPSLKKKNNNKKYSYFLVTCFYKLLDRQKKSVHFIRLPQFDCMLVCVITCKHNDEFRLCSLPTVNSLQRIYRNSVAHCAAIAVVVVIVLYSFG